MFYQNNIQGNSWMFSDMYARYWGASNQTLIPRNQYDGIFFVYETHAPIYLSKVSDSKIETTLLH